MLINQIQHRHFKLNQSFLFCSLLCPSMLKVHPFSLIFPRNLANLCHWRWAGIIIGSPLTDWIPAKVPPLLLWHNCYSCKQTLHENIKLGCCYARTRVTGRHMYLRGESSTPWLAGVLLPEEVIVLVCNITRPLIGAETLITTHLKCQNQYTCQIPRIYAPSLLLHEPNWLLWVSL